MSNELIQELVTIIRDTKGFVLEQAPEVLRQMIAYKIWSSIVWLVVGLVLSIVSVWAWRRVIPELRKHYTEQSDNITLFGPPLAVLLSLFGAITIMCSTESLIKATASPKLFLIEKLTSMASGGKCK